MAAQNMGKLTPVDAARARYCTSELQVEAAAIAPIYAGSSKVMKMIISGDVLKEDYEPCNTRKF